MLTTETAHVDEDDYRTYPWLAGHDERFTLALVLDVVEVVVRHGYTAPTGATLVDLTSGLFRALHRDSSVMLQGVTTAAGNRNYSAHTPAEPAADIRRSTTQIPQTSGAQ